MEGRDAPGWAALLLLSSCGADSPATPAAPEPPPQGAPTIFTDASGTHLPAGVLGGRDMDAHPGDVDGDGDLDLVVAVEFGANLLLVNAGDGRFAVDRERLSTPIHDSEDIALTDLDGDGDLDLVFVAEDDRVDELYLNDGSGRFTDASAGLPRRGTSNAVLAADLTGDGAPDLLVGNAGVNFFFVNDGSARFTDETAARYPGANRTTQDLELGDVDGDGDLDLVEANEDGNRLLLNDGAGRFTDVTAGRLPTQDVEETREADLGDVDGDGDLDLVLGNTRFRPGKDGVNRVLINDGRGFFTDESAQRLQQAVESTVDVDLADLDGDGDLDLVEANFSGRGYRVFVNDGAGRFASATTEFLPGSVTGVGVDAEVFDANGDGVPDLFFTHYRGPDHLLLGVPR